MSTSSHMAKVSADAPLEIRPATHPALIKARVDAADWAKIHGDLDAQGWAIVPKLLTNDEADFIAGLYHRERGFRSQVIMARHGFGRGDTSTSIIRLPPLIQALRTAAYPHLVPIANQWHERMGKAVRFPQDTPPSSSAAIRPVRSVRRRCCLSTGRRTTTACIATSMASMCSRYRSRSCWISRARISRAASS